MPTFQARPLVANENRTCGGLTIEAVLDLSGHSVVGNITYFSALIAEILRR